MRKSYHLRLVHVFVLLAFSLFCILFSFKKLEKDVLLLKSFTLIGLLILSISMKAQSIKDTIFKEGSFTDSSLHIVFKAPPHSIYHQRTIDLLLNGSLQEKDYILIPKSLQLPSEYIGEWLSIYKYNRRKYSYSPSEPYYNFYINIEEGIITMNDFNEGLTSYPVSNVRREKNKIIFIVSIPRNEKAMFCIKNKKRGIAIIQSDLFSEKKIVIAKKELFFSLPIIVNYCPFGRCGEFNFK